TMIVHGKKDSLSVSSSGNYMVKISSLNPCGAERLESIFSLNIKLPDIQLSDTTKAEICEGNDFEGYSQSGIYRDTFTSSTGCDSVRILDLTVKPNQTSLTEVTICSGETYEGYADNGEYTDVFVASNGCDSTRVL